MVSSAPAADSRATLDEVMTASAGLRAVSLRTAAAARATRMRSRRTVAQSRRNRQEAQSVSHRLCEGCPAAGVPADRVRP